MTQAISSALQGLQQADAQVDRAAAQISAWPSSGQFAATGSSAPSANPSVALPQSDSVDLSSTAVSLMQGKDSFDANASLIHVVDNMHKTLLNEIG